MLVAIVAWGIGNILIKQTSVDGLNVAFYRLWFGTALTMALLFAARHRLTLRELALSAPAGAAFGVNMVLFFTALKITTVANATLIGALQPAIVLLVAGPLFGERVGRWEIGWTAVSIAGVGILIAGASSSPEWSPLGDGMALLAVVLFTGYFVASKRIRESVATVAYMAGVHLAAAVVVTPIVLVHGLEVAALSTADWARIADDRLYQRRGGAHAGELGAPLREGVRVIGDRAAHAGGGDDGRLGGPGRVAFGCPVARRRGDAVGDRGCHAAEPVVGA